MTNPSGNNHFQAIERWIEQDDAPKNERDRQLTARLDDLRAQYSRLRYLGPAPAPATPIHARWQLRAGWLKPLAVTGALGIAVLAVSVMLHQQVLEPASTSLPAQDMAWNPDSPAAQIRALRSQMSAAVRPPEKPSSLVLELPPLPDRPSGYASGEESGPQSSKVLGQPEIG